MKLLKVVSVFSVLLMSNVSFAKFGSEAELFDAFNAVGLNVVVEITDVDSAQNLLVHKTSENSSKSIDQFNGAVPMATLDYTVKGTFTDTQYKAFSIAEIVLCYTSDNASPSRSISVPKNRFEKCYMLPNKIRDVVSKINSL